MRARLGQPIVHSRVTLLLNDYAATRACGPSTNSAGATATLTVAPYQKGGKIKTIRDTGFLFSGDRARLHHRVVEGLDGAPTWGRPTQGPPRRAT